MEQQTVIRVDHATIRFNLSKEKVDNLKEYVVKFFRKELFFQEFLALKDVSLDIKKGESWGLIGNNGAGKSTLLKLVSGILKPYKGSAWAVGKISPLIELGAGFDAELTARENIYLNGAVLGYSEKFIREHFAEIIDFAEVGKFLDVPIKNFSSGMVARLGFAVATIVKPDILIVDEVLSVGDYSFQKKCEKRMADLLSGGATLLYVSHSIDSVKELCGKAAWLENGQVKMQGESQEICDRYIAAQSEVGI